MHPALFQATAPLADPAELASWILHEDPHLLVLNKPGWLVCHPSKNGPWSSLVGAAREYTGLERLHLISRLDRETSGLVLLAKSHALASRLQQALEAGYVRKRYLAVLHGHLAGRTEVSRALEPNPDSPVVIAQRVAPQGGGKKAQTTFLPLRHAEGFTLAEVIRHTGRKHQIRVHAAWLGHPVVGDKIYGPDPSAYLEFVEKGWTPHLAEVLSHPRHLLHAQTMDFSAVPGAMLYEAPLVEDFQAFLDTRFR